MSADLVPVEAIVPEPGRWIVLVPVEVFGGDCDCHRGTEADRDAGNVASYSSECGGWGYGLCDAVQAWSDCNRANGQIYRVDDTEPRYRKHGETVRVWVADKDLPFFDKKFGEEHA